MTYTVEPGKMLEPGTGCEPYSLDMRPFVVETGKRMAVKPMEEAAEAFGAWQALAKDPDPDPPLVRDVLYECCDTVQAACNLMAAVGATPEDVRKAMEDVTARNEARGRYALEPDCMAAGAISDVSSSFGKMQGMAEGLLTGCDSVDRDEVQSDIDAVARTFRSGINGVIDKVYGD